jgi:hypothetical protein
MQESSIREFLDGVFGTEVEPEYHI